MSKGSKLRDSKTCFTPQSYVTIQIRNNSFKKKFIHHRSSVLHQLRATQSILNDSLSKASPARKSIVATPKSPFSQLLKQQRQSDFSNFLKQKEKKLKQNRRKNENFQSKHRICGELKNKLKQITNISHLFKQACAQKPKILKTQINEVSQSFFLPILDESKINSSEINTKKWIKKLRSERGIIEKSKKRLSNIKLQKRCIYDSNQTSQQFFEKDQKQADKLEKENQILRVKKMSLRDLYLNKQEITQKSMHSIHTNNNFYKLFCSARGSSKQASRQMIQVQAEQIRKLQQFISGTQPSQFKEHDKLVHINEFLKDRQNFKVLDRMYNHVKEKYAYKFKQMTLQTMEDSNLLSLVYYLENKNNMTEQQKKNLKSKMNFIE